MAYCPGCWMESRPDLPSVVPSWMPLQPGTDIPDWNDESFLTAWEDLMGALGARYDADPRLGYVDVGGFGAYGEWADAGERVTDANALRMIDAVASAFPHHHVLMSAVAVYTQPTVLRRAVDRWANLGLRSDCLGQPAMQVPEAGFDTLWTTRPFVTEWCTGADPATGRDQVRAHHVSTTSSHNMRLTYDQMSAAQKAAYEEAVRSAGYRYAVTRATVSSVSPGQPFQVDLAVANTGSAPTYDPWDVRLVLTDGSGTRVAALPLGIDLRTALPGTRTFTRTLTAPDVASGTYRVSVEVLDATGYSAPMRLANTSRAPDGSYPLGIVGVGAPTASSWPRDVTGDGAPDVLAIEARGGALRVYPTSGSGTWRTPVRQGSGWTGYAKVLTAGTWDADTVSDVLVQTTAGGLYLRRGTGDGTFAVPVRIGSGWGMHDLVVPVGDFDGDGNADLMARRASNGALYLYRGNGQGGFASPASRVIGTGWAGFTAMFSPGDFDGDGAVDLLARTRGGTLYLYRGDGTGSWKGRRTIGSGWQVFSALTSVGDFDGDGAADVLARDTRGTLWLYAGDGRGSWDLPRRKVGSGWQIFSSLLL